MSELQIKALVAPIQVSNITVCQHQSRKISIIVTEKEEALCFMMRYEVQSQNVSQVSPWTRHMCGRACDAIPLSPLAAASALRTPGPARAARSLCKLG